MVKRKTASRRLTRALSRIRHWCRNSRHQKVRWQQKKLAQKLQGHYAYYGITGNSSALTRFRFEALRRWCKWLRRRSQRAKMPWTRFNELLRHYVVPEAKCVHSIYVR